MNFLLSLFCSHAYYSDLSKVFSHKSGNSIFYDPLKDFIKINCAMRRMGNMNTIPKELNKIRISGEALSLEIIALYQ